MSRITLLSARDVLGTVGIWVLWSSVLNLSWEIAQLPLYAIPSAQSTSAVALAIAHCTVGDAVIAVASYLVSAIVLRDANWVASHPWVGSMITVTSGVSYTVLSEWYNVYQTGDWGYSSSMPLIFGIGLSPLLQWVLIPAVVVLLVRNGAGAGRTAN